MDVVVFNERIRDFNGRFAAKEYSACSLDRRDGHRQSRHNGSRAPQDIGGHDLEAAIGKDPIIHMADVLSAPAPSFRLPIQMRENRSIFPKFSRLLD